MEELHIVHMGLSIEQWFGLSGQLALGGWLILVFLPRQYKPLFYLPQYAIPFALGLLYSGLALTNFFVSDGDFNSFEGVRLLFENDSMLLAGWIHYLAFDLFIGSWIAQEADKLGVPRLVQAPILVATFIFGPVGLVVFLSMKSILSQQKGGQNVANTN